MKGLKLLLLAQIFFANSFLFATTPPDEGMWLPMLIKDYNYSEMQRLGLKLTAEQIYSVNNSSIKDAIVSFGGFCTGELISDEGLLLTNHHCGFDAIAESSSEENNYLDDGFWAMSRGEEVPIAGLYVNFLIRMEDVTDQINQVADNSSEDMVEMAVMGKIGELEDIMSEDGKYVVDIKEMFDGNATYAFVYQTFSDVRLVGAPPSSVGKFGGDTDNWMWPRHTGDFSMFRIYADKNNDPAEYSVSNIPYTPKHSLPVSTKGLKEGDFTMVVGFPGSTDRYLTSPEVRDLQENEAPIIASILKERLAIMKKEMDKSESVRINYASSYASLANTQKYFTGQLRGLKKFNQVQAQEKYEEEIEAWLNNNSEAKEKFGSVISDIKNIFAKYGKLNKDFLLINMAGFAPEFLTDGFGLDMWRAGMKFNSDEVDTERFDKMKGEEAEFFADYNRAMDREMIVLALNNIHDISRRHNFDVFQSELYKKKCKGSDELFADYLMKKSILTNQKLLQKFLNKPNKKAFDKDPGVLYVTSLINLYRSYTVELSNKESNLAAAREKYMEMLQMKESNNFYPDANSTMRVTYGTVKKYDSWEGKPFETFTYASQILDKYKPNDEEFDVPEKLRTLISNKDYGNYANEDGTLNVCFLHNTDITGGNSGSPVINGDGHLVGCAFDGNWESMTSDIFWQDDYVRTISVDIRYVLFIIDTYAGAGHLVKEMNLVD